MDFPERDWKHLRAVHPVALARYCERILAETTAIIEDRQLSPHERYLAVVGLIGDRNYDMAMAFDDMRRSTALRRIAALHGLGLLTDDELGGFSPDVRASAVALNDLLARPRPIPSGGRGRPQSHS